MVKDSEQNKAEAAGTTMNGFATTFGGIPLIFVHALCLVSLFALGWGRWRGAGLGYGALSVIVASLLGLGAAQLLFGGKLFYTMTVFVP